jgi:hypothetical protein
MPERWKLLFGRAMQFSKFQLMQVSWTKGRSYFPRGGRKGKAYRCEEKTLTILTHKRDVLVGVFIIFASGGATCRQSKVCMKPILGSVSARLLNSMF